MLETALGRGLALGLCALMFIACDLFAANWGKRESTWSLLAVIFLAPIAYAMFGYLNQKYPLAVVSSWIVLAILLTSTAFGIFFFKDDVTVRQWCGVVLAIIASVLLIIE